jgi:hypothetical protein
MLTMPSFADKEASSQYVDMKIAPGVSTSHDNMKQAGNMEVN